MGYEDQSLLCCQFDKMKEALAVDEWVPVHGDVDDLRQIKTEEELSYLAKAEDVW